MGTTFSQNVLADEQAFTLSVDGEAELAGLPDFMREAMKSEARERKLDGHVITLSRSSVEPFLQFSKRRDLREKIFRAFAMRGDNGGATDNKAIIAEMVRLRAERARLLGFPDFAHYRLDDAMAKTPAAVRELLDTVWARARQKALADRDAMQELVAEDGGNFKLAAWDWRYYAEKLRQRLCDFDEMTIKPYLNLDRMIEAVFYTAQRLFGLTFSPRRDVPVWHPDVRVWEVRDRDGNEVGLFFGDYFARPSKRSGAWMTSLRDQEKLAGDIRPQIINVCNFVKAPDGEPTLLSFDDARTLFHEFGHALHGLLSDVTYPRISGTGVATDFVELPSQLYEHWLEQPEVLRRFALHYETGEPMPEELLQRLLAARNFNMGFATVEYVASALVDLDFHSLPADRGDRCHRIREKIAGAHRHARRDRDAPPPAAFRSCLLRRRLCGGVLQLHVVGSARRRCLRGLRGEPATFSMPPPPSGCATRSTQPAAGRIRRMPTRRFAAACRAPTRCCASAALPNRPPSSPPPQAGEAREGHDRPAQRRPSPRRRLRAARGRRGSRPRHPRRRRQCARSHGGHGGDHRGRLSAHEPSRRRRLLADPRAVGPRARHHGARSRRPQRAAGALSRL